MEAQRQSSPRSDVYVEELKTAAGLATEEAEELEDARAKWEYIKYKIRQKARALEREDLPGGKTRDGGAAGIPEC
jgi:hypothetical protein